MTRPDGASELIHERVAQHARERPGDIALVHEGGESSYHVLNTAADRYAARLAAYGVGPGDIVPLIMPRSAQLVAVQLAVLKRGAAYAGLDVQWPPERISAVLEQIQPVITVTAELFPPEQLESVAAASTETLETFDEEVTGASPAMVFFTSGTTGGPKGVVVPHRSVTRLFGVGGLPGFGPGHATPQIAPLPWDMYAFELWGQLCCGGTSVLVSGEYPLPSTLRSLISDDGVDTLWLTTSLFNLFVDEDPDCFTGLKQVYAGGEKLSSAHVRTFLNRHPTVPLRNGYGPVESCMLTTTRLIRLADCDVPGGIPVGEPVPGTEVFVLGPGDKPCAPGEPGEICIAGSGLATGYLGRAEQTAERFVTTPILDRTLRIYRTGDRGLVDEQGCLHFLGRDDRQIKISGFRIELGEIEAATRQVPGVRDCTVVPVQDAEGRTVRLALYYLGPSSEEIAASPTADPLEVHKHLAQVLPAYLTPSAIRALHRFPLTPNGKRDAAAMLKLAQRPVRAVSRSGGQTAQ
jgi:D-alanine--poly(phosphoribitol) ligase subunit 1